MKIVTFNIRCDFNQDGENCFCHRKDLILQKISQEKPDIIGFQEVLPHVQKWLKENLSDYYIVGCGREKDWKDEYTSIAFRKDAMELFGLDVFWLSPTPKVPASRYESQSICPRTCTAAILKPVFCDTPILVYNTHLDHESAYAREKGLSQIFHRIKEDVALYSYPYILMGDFNAEPDSEELSLLSVSDILCLTDAAENLGITYHDYGKLKNSVKIDYLLVSPNLSIQKAELWKDTINGIFLSDHYPVSADITIKAL